MPCTYPLSQESLDEAVQKFSRLVWQRDPYARIDLRWGFIPGEVLIAVESPQGNDGYALNYVTGEWYRYVS